MPDYPNDTTIRIYITGTNGSGKGEVGKYLKEKHFFQIFNVRAFLEEVGLVQHVGLTKRPELGALADSLRDVQGADYLVRALTEKAGDTKLAVFDSVRTMGEVAYIKKLQAEVVARGASNEKILFIAVDADPKIRYQRIMNRKSITDQVSFEDFVAQEEAESHGSVPTRMNLIECTQASDILLKNDGTLGDFHQQIEEKLGSLIFDFSKK